MGSLRVRRGVGVALVVALVGACRAGSLTDAAAGDAYVPRGDGLPERIIVDSWPEISVVDHGGPPPGTDAAGDAAAGGDGATTGMDAGGAGDATGPAGDGPVCTLTAPHCDNGQFCYPAPFDGMETGDTACGVPGMFSPPLPCQSQTDCDGQSLCTAPGEPSAVCALRCGTDNPICPTGTTCHPLLYYPGSGFCL